MTLHELDLLSTRYRLTQEREDRRAALAAMILVNVNRDPEQRPQPFDLEEVVLWLGHGFQRREPPPSSEPAPPSMGGPLSMEQMRERVEQLNELYQSHPNGQSMDG